MTPRELGIACAEAEGWRAWRERRGRYTLCVRQAPGDPPPWTRFRHDVREEERKRFEAVSLADAARIGYFDLGLPPYGDNSAGGRSFAVELMQAHHIGVQPAGSHSAVDEHDMGAHWEAWANDPTDAEHAISACGATISEAVARCRVKLAEAKKGGQS